MKKVILILVVVLIIIGAIVFSKDDNTKTTLKTTKASSQTQTSKQNNSSSGTHPALIENDEDSEYNEYFDEDISPANKIYGSAHEAFAAVKKGAEEYDDIVLEQFADLDDSCEWCSELYDTLKSEMVNSDLEENQKSYYAELLAITGKVDNVSAIVDAFKDASESDDGQELFAEALELTAGNDDLVKYLSDELGNTDNELLQESLIAAVTNHGSPLAVQKLYDETIKQGDADGFYSYGIGVAEIIPDEDSLPLLDEMAGKKDDYSHLAIKALLNYGDDGLQRVVDIISGSDDRELNKKLLEDALDHVAFDENTEKLVTEWTKSSNPDVQQFASDILEDMEYEFAEDEEDYEDEDY